MPYIDTLSTLPDHVREHFGVDDLAVNVETWTSGLTARTFPKKGLWQCERAKWVVNRGGVCYYRSSHTPPVYSVGDFIYISKSVRGWTLTLTGKVDEIRSQRGVDTGYCVDLVASNSCGVAIVSFTGAEWFKTRTRDDLE